MKKYKVMIEGRNFLINVDGKNQKLGFYTTRWVEANNEHDAERFAIEIIRNDPKLNSNTLNKKTDPPLMHASEVKDIGLFEGDEPTPGYVFFPEDEEDE